MSDTFLQDAKSYLYGNYRPASVVFERGEGCELIDVNGKRYLDMCAGVAVCAVGHAHPTWVRRVSEQAARVAHVSNYFYNRENILLAKELCKRSGMDRAFFCNSGAEANEALAKLALHHYFAKGDFARTRFIAFDNAFHGRTLGSLALTGTPKYREGFGSALSVTHVPYGDLNAVVAAMEKNGGGDVAAIIVETVQGEGGVLPASKEFLLGLREIATKAGSLVLVDEVQTGMGRTGSLFGFQTAGVKPDAVSLAKGLAGGFPIGGMLTTAELAGALPPGTHGSTFGGNPLACAAALAVLEILDEENIVEQVAEKGAYLANRLGELVTAFPSVCESTRGQGLLRGLVLRPGFVAREILPKLLERGLLVTAAGDRVLRFTPPLVVSLEELGRAVDCTREVLLELEIAQTRTTSAGF